MEVLLSRARHVRKIVKKGLIALVGGREMWSTSLDPANQTRHENFPR